MLNMMLYVCVTVELYSMLLTFLLHVLNNDLFKFFRGLRLSWGASPAGELNSVAARWRALKIFLKRYRSVLFLCEHTLFLRTTTVILLVDKNIIYCVIEPFELL